MDSTTVARKFEYRTNKKNFEWVVDNLLLTQVLTPSNSIVCRTKWPRGLRRGSAIPRFLGLWVRIPLEA